MARNTTATKNNRNGSARGIKTAARGAMSEVSSTTNGSNGKKEMSKSDKLTLKAWKHIYETNHKETGK